MLPRPCGQVGIEPRRAAKLYAVRGRGLAEAWPISTADEGVDQEDVVGRIVDHKGAADVGKRGCPQPPVAKLPLPVPAMVNRGGRGMDGWW